MAGRTSNRCTAISIHALLAESDCRLRSTLGALPGPFLSTLSLRRATQYWATRARAAQLFLSTLSLRRATSLRASISGRASFLSTLSLRRATKERKVLIADVYIFRSTLSLRRATRSRGSPRILVRDFYPRSPCGERLHIGRGCVMIHRISIHALLAESDYERSPISLTAAEFLSTPSLRRATADSDSSKTYLVISIHTLLAESDSGLMLSRISAKDFYPRPPCGERRRWQIEQDRRKKFLSTLSLRRATYESEHQAFEDYNFYPRSPCGERPYMTAANSTRRAFLSTLSLRRATA